MEKVPLEGGGSNPNFLVGWCVSGGLFDRYIDRYKLRHPINLPLIANSIDLQSAVYA
ncbi:hypothetical protein QUA35_27855 [Microcoleus sp. N9_B2]|uniref:hypothetical protein n=1 Tax=unclassified Microcoleus TaxID=2642155 RepID=UPI002FD280B3